MKTQTERLEKLEGQVLVLTLFLRAALDKHPSVYEALQMGELETERLVARFSSEAFPEAFLDGIHETRKKFRPPEAK